MDAAAVASHRCILSFFRFSLREDYRDRKVSLSLSLFLKVPQSGTQAGKGFTGLVHRIIALSGHCSGAFRCGGSGGRKDRDIICAPS